MWRLAIVVFGALLTLSLARGQDSAPPSLQRVMGLDGQPWPIKAAPVGKAPQIETFDAPYVLTPGVSRPALWYLDGDVCEPVTWNPSGKRLALFEVVHSGGAYYLTYVVDGVNEFWHLDGAKAVQVTSGGKPLSQRARITRGGGKAYLYQGGADGSTILFELKGAEANAVKLPATDIGLLSYAWDAGGKLLTAFYKSGTYNFHVFADGAFKPAWDGNGEKEFELQVDSIVALWAGEKLFVSVTHRNKCEDIWFFDGNQLERVCPRDVEYDFRTYPRVANQHGLYFEASGALYLADGKAVPMIYAYPINSLACMGGSVLARGAEGAWLITAEKAVALDSADYELISHFNGTDVLRAKDGSMRLYRAGLRVDDIKGLPDDFGLVERAWQSESGAYWIEQTSAEAPAYRFWLLR